MNATIWERSYENPFASLSSHFSVKKTKFNKAYMSLELPQEIISEILTRLSVKPLLRFRCVSKSWCATIDSPDFISRHVKRSIETTTNHQLILEEWDFETRGYQSNLYSASIDERLDIFLKGLSKPLMHQSEDLFSNSCNGLIFLYNAYEAVALWNPFTRRCRKIPAEPFKTPSAKLVTPDWLSAFGFGYDSLHDDYRVVRILRFDPKDCWQAHEVSVYSLRTNTWRSVQGFPLVGYIFLSAYSEFASGASHWLVYKPISDLDEKDRYVIAAFDFVKEEFYELPLPKYTEEFEQDFLIVLQGCLCVLSCNYAQDATQVTLYMMKQYGLRDSWDKLYIFKQGDLPYEFEHAMPLIYSQRSDKLLLQVVCKEGFRSLVWYDLQEKKSSKVDICNKQSSFTVLVCLESLVRLGEDDHFDGAHESVSNDASSCSRNEE
ncbi:F-box protein CPR1-like isoform X2 [Tripterygium wilfordii]|uniref:F-box protein CPR1-like isoform X2 n=1 Tax=Tripterygium wilfordii TaxID=458696 RepID=UPI0018F82131|nr:F-box protein CPR1-like isoform X2 [Tripterygium wilfordii]